MTAYNVVRFRVKPGRDQEFIDVHRVAAPEFTGMRRFSMVNTGEGTYCIIGEWDSFDDIVAARTGMVGMLDRFRHMLEDVGTGLGVTDPVSGDVVLEMGVPRKRVAKRKAPSRPKSRAKPAKKKTSPKKAVKKKTSRRGKTR
jgi:hypothetical protein